ncbi:MAG TPA: hypothetical protein DEB39_06350, partial [Planctomycetaceae bacterium]|nr:hypothetical protein [Planctomycetaceae bacterium]
MKRHAYTLVELVVVLAGEAVLFGLATAIVFLLLDFRTKTDEAFSQADTIRRLSETFRRDVHDAEAFTAPWGIEDGMDLEMPDGRAIHYVFHQQEGGFMVEVVRTESVAVVPDMGGFAQEEMLSTERFMLDDGTQVRFYPGKERNEGLAALSVWTNPQRRINGTAAGALGPPGGFDATYPEDADPFARTLPEDARERSDPRGT